MNGPARKRRTRTGKGVGAKLRAVVLSTIMILSVVSGAVVVVAPAAAANVSASVTVTDSSPGASTNHNWTTTIGSSQTEFAAITLNYTNAQTNVSNLDGNAGNVEVTVAGNPVTVSRVSATSDRASINFGKTTVSPGDKVVVNVTGDLIGNPSSEGTYTGTIELSAISTPFQTNDADFEISAASLPNAPYVNKSDDTHDPTTDTTLSADYNATGEMASSDVVVEVTDSSGTTLASNASLSATEGTATLTITGGTLSGDERLTYQLINKNTATVNATDDSWLNGTGGGGDTTAPKIVNLNLAEQKGNMAISFDSGEQLGKKSGDLTVSVVGPNGATYTFDRKQFAESGSRPYTYSLSTTQAYDDGGGSYTMSVDDAKDSAGNNGGNNGAGSGLTDTHVYSSGSGTDTWINGTVTDASGSVSGATVVAVPQSGGSETVVTTGANGDYSLGIQPSTTYDVIVDDEPDHEFEVETGISVSKSNTKTVDFTVKAFPEKGFINGTVLDADGNAVSSGYSVKARELGYRFGGTATTDANGEFSVSVPASNYIVRAKGSNSPPETLDNVTVREGETTDVTIRLPEAGYISGTVEDAAGKKVGGVGVVADDGNQIVFDTTNVSTQADTGTYNITAPPGNYTVSVFTKGKSTTSKQVTVTGGSGSTADFTLRTTSVKHASVEVIEGSGVDTANLGISASVRAGMLQVKVTNQSSSGGGAGPPDELEGLGVTRDTKLRMNVTVTNFTANSLMWGVGDARWSTADNASITNGTDITVTGTPVQLQVMFGGKGGGAETGVGPLMFKDPSQVSWPTGRKDQATAGRNVTVYFGVFDLGNVPGSVRNNLKGMSVTTNAQRFSTPSVVNQSLRVWVAAPTKTVAGNDHNGFYQAEIPDSQLSEWGVDDPESELNALYKGDATNFTVTETDSGARIRLDNISYSAGFAEIEANPSDSTSSTTTTTATTPERTVGTVTESSSGTASVTVDNVELDDPLVVPLSGVGTDAMTVEEVTATFDMGTNVDNEMRVRATDAPPATVPAIAGDVRSYLTVEVEGNLADRVSRGSFTFSLDADVASNDPGAVTAYRYHDDEWQRVTTRHLGGTRFEVVSPGYSTFAVVVTDRQSTPDRTATPTPEPVTTAEPPTTSEPVSTTEPSTTSGSEPAATTAAEPTPTSGPATAAPTTAERETTPTAGAGSPGFGVVAVLAAVLALLALGRRN